MGASLSASSLRAIEDNTLRYNRAEDTTSWSCTVLLRKKNLNGEAWVPTSSNAKSTVVTQKDLVRCTPVGITGKRLILSTARSIRARFGARCAPLLQRPQVGFRFSPNFKNWKLPAEGLAGTERRHFQIACYCLRLLTRAS